MIKLFDIADVNASASSFNPDKLKWLNQQYIIKAPKEQLAGILAEQMHIIGIDGGNGPPLDAVVDAYRERATTIREMAENCRYCFDDLDQIDPKSAKKHLRPVALEPLRDVLSRFESLSDWSAGELSAAIEESATEHEINMGKIGQPLRVAVTGGPVSPPIDVTLELVGRKRSLARITNAISLIVERASKQ